MQNLPKTIERWISTKKDEESVAVKTLLTVDLSGITWDHILEYALMAIVVKFQGWIRKQKGDIPTAYTYKVPVPGTKTVVDAHAVKVQTFIDMGFEKDVAERLAVNPTLIRKALAGELE